METCQLWYKQHMTWRQLSDNTYSTQNIHILNTVCLQAVEDKNCSKSPDYTTYNRTTVSSSIEDVRTMHTCSAVFHWLPQIFRIGLKIFILTVSLQLGARGCGIVYSKISG